MIAEASIDEFHHSEVGDIYDLYNACNGVLYKGCLDKRKLDEYSPEDAEEINVLRLREVWEHTASGCPECENIISALNQLRGLAKKACASSI